MESQTGIAFGVCGCLFGVALVLNGVSDVTTERKFKARIELLENKEKGRSEMTAFFTCDNCGKTIKDTRIQIVDDDQGEPEFLYYFVGDDEGEETDKHYCAKCLAFLLVGHGDQEEVEAEGETEPKEGADEE